MSLSGRTKDILKIALADRIAGKEVAAALEAAAWNIVALEIATTTAPSAAFTKVLHVGDLVEVTAASGGTTTFHAVTAVGTMPVALTVASGDLCRASRKVAAQTQQITLPSPHA